MSRRVVSLSDDAPDFAILVRHVVERRLDAVLVTRAGDARRLLRTARRMALTDALNDALHGDVVVGAIDLGCARALRRLGVTPDVIPAARTAAALVAAVDDYFALIRPYEPSRKTSSSAP